MSEGELVVSMTDSGGLNYYNVIHILIQVVQCNAHYDTVSIM